MSTNVEQHNIQLYWKVKSNEINTTKCITNPWPNPTQAIRVSKYFPTCLMCIALPWQDKILQHQELPMQCHNEHCSDNQRVPDNEENKRSISNKKKKIYLKFLQFSDIVCFLLHQYCSVLLLIAQECELFVRRFITLYFKPKHPSIRMYILHTVLYKFPQVVIISFILVTCYL